jgi:hypothetical protein
MQPRTWAAHHQAAWLQYVKGKAHLQDKLLQRIKGLTEFKVDVIHFTYCIKALCPFKEKYKKALLDAYPDIKIVIGTHQVMIEPEEYREKVRRLFSQEKKNMVDVILKRD